MGLERHELLLNFLRDSQYEGSESKVLPSSCRTSQWSSSAWEGFSNPSRYVTAAAAPDQILQVLQDVSVRRLNRLMKRLEALSEGSVVVLADFCEAEDCWLSNSGLRLSRSLCTNISRFVTRHSLHLHMALHRLGWSAAKLLPCNRHITSMQSNQNSMPGSAFSTAL